MSTWRNIIVDGQRYRWRGSSFVVVQDAAGKRVCSGSAPEIKGFTWTEWERGHWKRTPDGMMRPSEVAAFIRLSRSLAFNNRQSGGAT